MNYVCMYLNASSLEEKCERFYNEIRRKINGPVFFAGHIAFLVEKHKEELSWLPAIFEILMAWPNANGVGFYYL